MSERLAAHVRKHPGLNLADAAFTLQSGRSRFQHRLFVVADDCDTAAQALDSDTHAMRGARAVPAAAPSLIWVFPGQGAQYAGMGRGLYATDPAFREAFDECVAAFGSAGPQLRQRMFADDASALHQTATTQPAIFCLEYALAKMWLAKGAEPAAMIGHSIGEYAAAVMAGVMSLPDAAALVALRGSLMQELPEGSMLSIRMPRTRVEAMLPAGLAIAAHNGPQQCVVAGPGPIVNAFSSQLARDSIPARMLNTSHAFHSAMMEPAVGPFQAAVRNAALNPPRTKIFSTLTGRLLTREEALDPGYWARHLREPVQFSNAIQLAALQNGAIFLEVGPGRSLSNLVRQNRIAGKDAPIAIASLATDAESERSSVLLAQGHLWTLGIEPEPVAFPPSGRRRIALPTYPFERQRHALEPVRNLAQSEPDLLKPWQQISR